MSFFATTSFDATKVAPSTGFQPLPEGPYTVQVKSCAEEKTRDGSGLMLKAELAVVEPAAFRGRTLFHRITLRNRNAQAVEIGQAELSAFCRGCGVMQPKHAAQFTGRSLTVQVRVEKRQDNGELTNRVSGVVLPAPAAPVAGGQQVAAQQAGGAYGQQVAPQGHANQQAHASQQQAAPWG